MFNHAIVTPRAFAIHADLDSLHPWSTSIQAPPGKLAALVRIKYLVCRALAPPVPF
jgi:hypothetical protein